MSEGDRSDELHTSLHTILSCMVKININDLHLCSFKGKPVFLLNGPALPCVAVCSPLTTEEGKKQKPDGAQKFPVKCNATWEICQIAITIRFLFICYPISSLYAWQEWTAMNLFCWLRFPARACHPKTTIIRFIWTNISLEGVTKSFIEWIGVCVCVFV